MRLFGLFSWGGGTQTDNSSRSDIAVVQSRSVCEELRWGSCAGLTPPENMRERWREKVEGEEVLNKLLKALSNWKEHLTVCVVAVG